MMNFMNYYRSSYFVVLADHGFFLWLMMIVLPIFFNFVFGVVVFICIANVMLMMIPLFVFVIIIN